MSSEQHPGRGACPGYHGDWRCNIGMEFHNPNTLLPGCDVRPLCPDHADLWTGPCTRGELLVSSIQCEYDGYHDLMLPAPYNTLTSGPRPSSPSASTAAATGSTVTRTACGASSPAPSPCRLTRHSATTAPTAATTLQLQPGSRPRQ